MYPATRWPAMTPSIIAASEMMSLFPSPSPSSWSSATENRLPVRVARRDGRGLMGVGGTPSTPDWTGVLGTVLRAEMPNGWLSLAVSVRSGVRSLLLPCCWRLTTVESPTGPRTTSGLVKLSPWGPVRSEGVWGMDSFVAVGIMTLSACEWEKGLWAIVENAERVGEREGVGERPVTRKRKRRSKNELTYRRRFECLGSQSSGPLFLYPSHLVRHPFGVQSRQSWWDWDSRRGHDIFGVQPHKMASAGIALRNDRRCQAQRPCRGKRRSSMR